MHRQNNIRRHDDFWIVYNMIRSGNLCAVSIFDLLVGLDRECGQTQEFQYHTGRRFVHFKIQKKTIIHQSMKR